ncbi:DM13 domain-containing protein [Corynebacterium felinum]|uniref:DM13 domain-containing protein n=1 Tax=Corynebacterium felinum TaxID=131318 RepID=A0ABU2B7J0_9CORY|nr:DM13 domain-containing protein [Corynebacterium felinum]MDF5821665.1 DM13 domain-containing protein [Corynebacterium felinum]MDR7353743.1 hypothetical protein [Corynebacterium felinum]WJY95922.1 Electron transfer DM13 [Corynebacterium felinum]
MKKALKILLPLGVVVLAIALVVFKPWLLFIDKQVNDEIPSFAAPSSQVAGMTTQDTHQGQAPSEQSPTAPVLVAQGDFISHEHTTTGRALVFQLPNGNYQLALENLSTSNGPDVKVWFSQGPVVEGVAGWTTAADHPHLSLGDIKGNIGNQVYDLPEDFDPSQWPTVDLWCEQFGVSFGAAALNPA